MMVTVIIKLTAAVIILMMAAENKMMMLAEMNGNHNYNGSGNRTCDGGGQL